MPKVQPKSQPAFLGFTQTAEIWNSRACMIGLIGTFIVELVSFLHKMGFCINDVRQTNKQKLNHFRFTDSEQGNTRVDRCGDWERA